MLIEKKICLNKINPVGGSPSEISSNNISLVSVSMGYMQSGNMRDLFSGITFKFSRGQSYAITGISGSGKSTLVALLSGLEKPTEGQVLLNGSDVTDLATSLPEDFFGSTVGLVLQTPYMINELTVLENVYLKGIILGLDKKECINRGRELLSCLGLEKYSDALPATLSVGQQQRVSVARALFGRPSFLVADEPTANLDAESRDLVLKLLDEFRTKFCMGVIISCHDLEVSRAMSQCLKISAGKLITVKPNISRGCMV